MLEKLSSVDLFNFGMLTQLQPVKHAYCEVQCRKEQKISV